MSEPKDGTRERTLDRRGATAIEYALIASLIFIVIILGVTAVGTNLNSVFADTANGFN